MITKIKELHEFLILSIVFLLFQSTYSIAPTNSAPDLLKSAFQNLTTKSTPSNRWHIMNDQTSFFSPTSIENHVFKDKKVAVLVVGLFSNPSTIKFLGQFLKKKNRYDHVFCFSYGLGEPNLLINTTNEISKGLTSIICQKEKTAEPIQLDIFAHSFGGLLIRYTLEKTIPSSMSSESTRNILDKCNHIFFFGTPHKEINPIFVKNIVDNLYNKATQNSFIAMYTQHSGLSSEATLNYIKKLDEHECLTNRTKLFNHLKSIPKPNNYYNIIGTKHNIELNPINLNFIKFSINTFFHDAYKKINSQSISDGVISKEIASLVPQGLEPSHELAVNYNHNELIGINNRETPNKIPKPIRQWIKSVLKGSILK